MKTSFRQIILVLVLPLVCLSACTESQKLRELSIQSANSTANQELQNEASEGLQSKPELSRSYVKLLSEQTIVETGEPKVVNDNAEVQVRVAVIPKSVRVALINIIATHDPGRDKAFNIIDAVKLIRSKQGLSPEKMDEKTLVIRFKKTDSWQVIAK